MLAVEKGIPLPERGRGAESRYPIAQLEVGDSFFVPDDQLPKSRAQGFHSLGGRYGFRLRVRSVDGGVRVWRAA